MLAQRADRVAKLLADKLDPAGKSAKVPYPNGDHYEGQTDSSAQGVRHGYGIYHYANGQGRYEGEFVDDEKHGRGSFFFDAGDAYDGQWCGNRQHGRGVSVHWSPSEGVWVYEGEFRRGQREGSGALIARGRGALCGTWTAGSLVRGVELHMEGADGGLRAAVVGAPEEAQPGMRAASPAAVSAPPDLPPAASPTGGGSAERRPLGPAPREWQPAEVRLWLWGLGLEEAAERPAARVTGAQLLAAEGPEELAASRQLAAGTSGLAQGWRSTLRAAHAALCKAVEDSQAQLGSWEELQSALPSIRKRCIPLEEIALGATAVPALGGAPQPGEWRGLSVEVFPLPLRLALGPGGATGARLSFGIARGWARDLEALATARHPNLRTLLGITVAPTEGDAGTGAAALVYEASRGGSLLFEWIHANLPDGSRRPLEVTSKLRICMGLCEGLAVLASRGLVCGALCSVNVELTQGAGGLVARLARLGSCWWRWGWRAALQVREAGQPRRRALSVDEVVRRYAACPVNWQAPEVLRGADPAEAADVYAFGMVLWEMLCRAIPFGDFSIAQIIGTVGYGRRPLRSAASSGASTETSYLHEVVTRCCQWDPAVRPPPTVLLDSLRDVARGYEQRKARRGMLGKLGDQTESFAFSLLSGGLQRSFYGSEARKAGAGAVAGGEAAAAGAGAEEGRRMVRLATGEWVRVHADLLEQFPGDEEKWRTLMAFRARLRLPAADGL